MSDELVKAPPQSIEAEQAVLGTMIESERERVRAADLLRPEMFWGEAHREIFAAVRGLTGGVAYVVLVDALKASGMLDAVGGAGYVALLVESVSQPYNTEAYCGLIEKAWRQRELLRLGREMVEAAFQREAPDDITARVEGELARIATGSSQLPVVLLEDVCREFMERLDNPAGDVVAPTGFAHLNNILDGGWRAGDVTVIAARPSVGKTAMGIQHAVAAANAEAGVLIASLEMKALQVVRRMIAAQGRVRLNRLRTGKTAMQDADWEGATEALGRLVERKALIHLADRITTVREIRSTARRIREKTGNLKLVVIDYIQLLRPEGRHHSREREVAQLSRDLKMLARELGVSVMVLAQINREIEKRGGEPRLSDLRESGAIEQDADNVLFLHYPGAPGEDKPEDYELDYIAAKQRDGRLGRLRLRFEGAYQRFGEVEGGRPEASTRGGLFRGRRGGRDAAAGKDG